MKKYLFDLQWFAEGEPPVEEPKEPENKGGEPSGDPKPEAKYTDADLDKIINKKFAEWQKQHEKKVSEAERLANMTAEEKAAQRLKDLEEKIAGYEKAEAKSAMTKQARGMLQDKNIHVSDELLANLIAEDAEGTKAAVESFINLFNAAVEKAVKDKVKGEPPKAGAPSGITKEQIMNISNRAERQQKIRENIELFK